MERHPATCHQGEASVCTGTTAWFLREPGLLSLENSFSPNLGVRWDEPPKLEGTPRCTRGLLLPACSWILKINQNSGAVPLILTSVKKMTEKDE